MKPAFPLLAALALAGSLRAQTPVPAELPKPAGLKVITELPQTAIYSAPGTVDQARAGSAKALAAAGWVPYGESGPVQYYKKGKVRAQVMIGSTPPPENKTMLTYMAEAMSADLPAPAGATELQYTDKRLGFFTAQSPDEVDAAYRKLLAPGGWFSKMEKPEKFDLDYVVIYRHPTEGKIELAMRPGQEKLHVTATYQTQREVDAEEARAAKQGKVLKEKLAAQANAPAPEVTIALPKATTKHFAIKDGLALNLTAGTAMAGAQAISTGLQAQGWKAATPSGLAKETGMIDLTRDDLRISLVYMDPGMIPAEITINAPGVTLKTKP